MSLTLCVFLLFTLCYSSGPEDHLGAVKKLQEESRASAKVCVCVRPQELMWGMSPHISNTYAFHGLTEHPELLTL